MKNPEEKENPVIEKSSRSKTADVILQKGT